MKKILSIVLLLLFLLSTVSCNKDAAPIASSATSETTATTTKSPWNVDPHPDYFRLLELQKQYGFVLTNDFIALYDGACMEQDGEFREERTPYFSQQCENFVHPTNIAIGFLLNSNTKILLNYEFTKYTYISERQVVDDVVYCVVLHLDHTKSVVNINDFEVKELVEQPNEDLRQCPNEQTGYFVIDDSIYCYYENGNLKFVRWACADIQFTYEVKADKDGYGLHTYDQQNDLFLKKSTIKTYIDEIMIFGELKP